MLSEQEKSDQCAVDSGQPHDFGGNNLSHPVSKGALATLLTSEQNEVLDAYRSSDTGGSVRSIGDQ